MSVIRKRLDFLERQKAASEEHWHIVHMDEDQSYLSAFQDHLAENPDRPIDPDDHLIWVRSVSVKRDANGNRVPEPEDNSEPPSLAEMLEAVGR